MSLFPSCSVPVIAARRLPVTCEQLFTNGALALAFATSASRTCSVRPHTPPVRPACLPSTLCAVSAASAPWPSSAAVPRDPVMVAPSSRMPFSGTAMPSSAMSSRVTV